MALPPSAGLTAVLEVLATATANVSVGQVCGGRISAVWLGDSLELVAVTLEPHELTDAAICRAKALAFVAELPS